MSDLLRPQSITPENFRRIREVFESALEHPPEERQAFVENACGRDRLLIEEVQRMLAAEGQPDQLLDRAQQVSPAREQKNECSSCKAVIAISDRFCRSCGTPVESVSRTEGRFRTGALFASRFRIVGLIGRGGMGEIYRAHDLELDQPVALKFLTAVRFDERARSRLRNEVRLARQVTHPNVCRVYDIGEAQGELYLSMEYVDGEDLAALLRRIGRLPVDKGLEIALKLCAGLAAAHAKGMLHRDLKPANIMIDSSGEVRIMDFGLAAIADDLRATQVQEGTPFYMSPEQLAGQKVSVQSDIYALGLVLYEMLTGKLPFTGNTPAELRRLREENRITPPSTLVPDLDPTVERAILRCLDPDPKIRPASALAVSALLPGGDPLAQALAAGETPSPEMVAAAGSTEPLRPAVAIMLLAGIAVGLAALCLTASKVQLLDRLSLENPPDVLIAKAREITRNLGYAERPADWAWGFRNEEGYFEYMQAKVSGDEQWRKTLSMPPAPISFWYRQSPTPLRVNERGRRPPSYPPIERVLADDPLTAGMVSLGVDTAGRLVRFAAHSQSDGSSPKTDDQTQKTDWAPLFAAARLDPARFSPTTPQSVPSVPADDRAAWTGAYAERPEMAIRVEAGSFHGKVVYFEIVPPWTRAVSMLPDPSWIANLLGIVFLSVAIFARLNWKTGRADVSGAWRVGLFILVLTLLVWALASHHSSSVLAVEGLLLRAIPFAAYNAALMSVCYLALEPWGRRQWPGAMITWSRVLLGRWRDPLVGRDILIGLLVGVGLGCLQVVLVQFNIIRLGGPPAAFSGVPNTENYFLYHLMGPFASMTGLVHALWTGFGGGLVVSASLLVFMLLLRNKWLAFAAFILTFFGRDVTTAHWTTLLLSILGVIFLLWVIVRLGIFVWTVANCAVGFITAIITTDFTMWYGASSLMAVILVSGLALLGFRLSLLGRPLRPSGAIAK